MGFHLTGNSVLISGSSSESVPGSSRRAQL